MFGYVISGRYKQNIESGVSKATFVPSPSWTNPPGADLHSPAGWRTGQSAMIRLG